MYVKPGGMGGSQLHLARNGPEDRAPKPLGGVPLILKTPYVVDVCKAGCYRGRNTTWPKTGPATGSRNSWQLGNFEQSASVVDGRSIV